MNIQFTQLRAADKSTKEEATRTAHSSGCWSTTDLREAQSDMDNVSIE